MTIWLYTGTPGSGKSYHATYDVVKKLKQKENNKVICNYVLGFSDEQKHLNNNFIYRDNSEMTVKYFVEFALENHDIGVEGQSLIVIDEAQIIFNSRSWNTAPKERMQWIKFFSQHRKLGYNIIMITQNDRMIDRQIRSLVEYEVAHLKINNFFMLLPCTTFLAVYRWYGQKMKTHHEILFYRKKIASYYNSYAFFENDDIVNEFL